MILLNSRGAPATCPKHCFRPWVVVSSETKRGAGAVAPHWHVDQNAKREKRNVFSTFETVLCTGVD